METWKILLLFAWTLCPAPAARASRLFEPSELGRSTILEWESARDLEVGREKHARKILQFDSTALGNALIGEARNGTVEDVQRLLDSGADPNFQEADGRLTPLIQATFTENTPVIRVLIAAGADPDGQNSQGIFPLLFAAFNGLTASAEALLEGGADPNRNSSTGDSPVHDAVVTGHIEVLMVLLEGGGDVFMTTLNDENLLHFAAQYGEVGVVKFLLDEGVSPNASRSSDERTPLHFAARSNSGVTTKALIEAGVVIDARSDAGFRPLEIAAFFGNEETIEVLVIYGADITLTRNDFTALDALCQCTFQDEVDDDCQVELCDRPSKMIQLLTS